VKQPLLIVGAGAVGGYLSWNMQELGPDYEVLGFLDDDPSKEGTLAYGRRVLGPVERVREYPGAAVAVGIAAPRVRQRIVEHLSPHTNLFPSFVAPGAWLSESVSVGRGTIIYPGVSINFETVVGDFCILNMNCAIGHNCTLSEYSTLAPGVNFAGFTLLEPLVDVGIGAATRQGVRIGEGAVVGGQSMVIRDVACDATVVGVPAGPISARI
jgi:sugar O-acyltransferase (sialic acid O-acetyltransferase NeuD family)